VLAGISLLGILVAIFLRLVTGAIVGQASTLILVLFLGGIQLIFLGIIGEYLGRIYDEVRARPLYVVHHLHGFLETDEKVPVAHTRQRTTVRRS
jgi:dolichol-phosphate mannosyltransferase